MYRQILRGKFEFPSPEWDHISNDAKDFISKLLIVDPEKRYTAKQVGKQYLAITMDSFTPCCSILHSTFYVLILMDRPLFSPGCAMNPKEPCIWMELSVCWNTLIFAVDEIPPVCME